MVNGDIFTLPLILYYDNDEIKEKNTGKKGSKKDNISMFLKTKLISFPDSYAYNWYGEKMANERFAFKISEEMIAKYEVGKEKENQAIYMALCELNNACENETIEILAHRSKKTKSLYEEFEDGTYRWKYHYVKFSDTVVRKLSRVFVSTVLFNAQSIAWPVDEVTGKKILPEGLTVEFDLNTHIATLVDVSVYSPKEVIPFQIYINDVLNKIWDEIDRETTETDERPVDYYTDLRIDRDKDWGMWQPVEKLDEALGKGLTAPYGIYMLFNSEDKTFYVGKGNEVYSRINQHRKNKNPNEPMRKFDYFRFSLVDKRYWKELFLIENAAIHNCASIINMPNAKTGHLNKISLQTPVDSNLKSNDKKENHITADINGITLVNAEEAQTRWNR